MRGLGFTFLFLAILHLLNAHGQYEDMLDLRPKRAVNADQLRSELAAILHERSADIPDELSKVVGALESALDLLKCLPLERSGNCYRPNDFCEIDLRDITIQAKLTICKRPWKLRIDFKLPRDFKKKIPGIVRPFVFIDVAPIELTLNHNKIDGITELVSNSRIVKAGIKLLGLKLNAAKAYFNFNLLVRWDCTKPSNNVKRLEYNQAYDDRKPGNDMNKLYYKLKIGYEIKVKKFPCFCYRRKKHETILDKQGHFAEGPESCKSDWSEWSPRSCTFFMQCEGISRRRTCVGQSTGGPPCPGSSTLPCGSPFRGKRAIRGRRMMCP